MGEREKERGPDSEEVGERLKGERRQLCLCLCLRCFCLRFVYSELRAKKFLTFSFSRSPLLVCGKNTLFLFSFLFLFYHLLFNNIYMPNFQLRLLPTLILWPYSPTRVYSRCILPFKFLSFQPTLSCFNILLFFTVTH